MNLISSHNIIIKQAACWLHYPVNRRCLVSLSHDTDVLQPKRLTPINILIQFTFAKGGRRLTETTFDIIVTVVKHSFDLHSAYFSQLSSLIHNIKLIRASLSAI